MHTGYSPYDMVNESIRLISELSDTTQILPKTERQIILLLNKAETYSYMSTYQLANAHKVFADLYFEHGYTGSALQHYQIAQSLYPKIAIKRKLNKLLALPKEKLIFSIDANIIDEPDYSNLIFHEIALDDDFYEKRQRERAIIASQMGFTIEELDEIKEKAAQELYEEVQKENNIYDPEFEKELEERLSKLGDIYKKEFYRIRSNRKPDNILSNRKLDLLDLEAMERSFSYRNSQTTKIMTPSVINDEQNLDMSRRLIKSHLPAAEYLQTRWGTYEMPEPYIVNLKRGPRDDLKKI